MNIPLERVLIIDDSEDIQQLIGLFLHKTWPDCILETYDPRCGIPESSFNWSRYDLLILDYDLGIKDQNGLDWYSKLRLENRLPATIMLTGYNSEKLATQSVKYGINAFLDKSKLTHESLSGTIKKAFENIESRKNVQVNGQTPGEMTEILSTEEKKKILDKMKSKQEAGAEIQDFEKTHLLSTKSGIETPDTGTSGKNKNTDIRDSSQVNVSGMEPEVISGAGKKPNKHITQRSVKTIRRIEQSEDIPIIVPGYLIEKKIGEGGMATIYLAYREEDNMKVVLKVLSLKSKDDPSLLRRFIREYKLIAQIQHKNVVQIYERAFASNFAYIAMEYFGYGDLTERLKNGVDTKTAINYLRQITEGLGAAHAKGIVHRDMKPANILFRSEDSLAVADFGIAKALDAEQVVKQLTMDGELMGTLYYISPEQILDEEADQRSDIYSLGVIMYKMLSGKHPYIGTSPEELFEAHLNAPIPLLPEKYSSLQPILNGLLEKDPAERFQSTDDLLMGLNWQEWD